MRGAVARAPRSIYEIGTFVSEKAACSGTSKRATPAALVGVVRENAVRLDDAVERPAVFLVALEILPVHRLRFGRPSRFEQHRAERVANGVVPL